MSWIVVCVKTFSFLRSKCMGTKLLYAIWICYIASKETTQLWYHSRRASSAPKIVGFFISCMLHSACIECKYAFLWINNMDFRWSLNMIRSYIYEIGFDICATSFTRLGHNNAIGMRLKKTIFIVLNIKIEQIVAFFVKVTWVSNNNRTKSFIKIIQKKSIKLLKCISILAESNRPKGQPKRKKNI